MTKWLTTTQVAEILGFTPSWVRTLAQTKLLHGRTTNGSTGVAQRYYFDEAEVEAFAEGGAPAAKLYRESKEKKTKGKGRHSAARA